MKRLTLSLLFAVCAVLVCSAQTTAKNFIKEKYGSFSVIGDSYSTFMGFTEPLSNAQWYPHAGNAMLSVEMTWWKLFERDFDITLEQNNSFSGSTICTHSWNNTTDLTNSFVGRVSNLRKAGLIIVEGATNDSNAGSTMGTYVWSDFTSAQKRTFRGGTAYVIDYLQKKYPESQIIFMLNHGLKTEINESVEAICEHYNVPLLKLHNIGKIDDHPTIQGMKDIRDQLEQLLCELNDVTCITEDEPITIAENKQNASVMVMRKMRQNQVNSLCLPFAMSQEAISQTFGEGTKVYGYDGYSDGVLSLTEVETIDANKPYFVRPTEEISNFCLTDVNIEPSDPVTVGTEACELTGTYTTATIRKGKKDAYVIAPNGTCHNTENQAIYLNPMDVSIYHQAGEGLKINLNGESVPNAGASISGLYFTPTTQNSLHAPATPILTADPFFSIWSGNDILTDGDTKHITNNSHALRGYVEIDGQLYRFMGTANSTIEKKIMGTTVEVAVAEQVNKSITATQTFYTFNAGGMQLSVVFSAPQIVTDASSLDAAINYILYKVSSTDGNEHVVKFFFVPSTQLSQRGNTGSVTSILDDSEGVIFGRMGNATQNLSEGNEANWGYIMLMADANRSQAMERISSALIFSDDMGMVKEAADYTLIGRDENTLGVGFGYARFPAPWQQRYHSFGEAMIDYSVNAEERLKTCREFDEQLYTDALWNSGEKEYADLCQIAYRQVIAAFKRAVSDTGKTLMYNVDAGATWQMNQADQMLAAAPLFLLYNPQLALDLYEATPDYIHMYPGYNSPYGNAPECLGLYWPVMAGANLNYGVDATTDYCILAGAAIKNGAGIDNIDDYSYQYLKSLCDYLDLFTLTQYQANFPNEGSWDGSINDYANLRMKCVLAMSLVADIAKVKGNSVDEQKYREMATRWEVSIRSKYLNDDHYKQGSSVSWGQKYPLFYDKALKMNIFSDVIDTELAYYRQKDMQTYGLPLDARSVTNAKVHASMLTAAMDIENFGRYVQPLCAYANDDASQRPIADVYNCKTGTPTSGYASSALGSLWAKVLINKALDIPEGIEDVNYTTASKGGYDLQGRKVNNPAARGIYIINGRKVVF